MHPKSKECRNAQPIRMSHRAWIDNNGNNRNTFKGIKPMFFYHKTSIHRVFTNHIYSIWVLQLICWATEFNLSTVIIMHIFFLSQPYDQRWMGFFLLVSFSIGNKCLEIEAKVLFCRYPNASKRQTDNIFRSLISQVRKIVYTVLYCKPNSR